MSPISDKKSNLNLFEIWANVSHNFTFSNWASLNHLVSSSTQFLSAWFYCIKGQIKQFYCSKHNLRVSKPRIFLAASVNRYSKTTRKVNYTLQTKVNRACGTMKKNDIYYELVSFNSIMKIDRVKKLVSLQNIQS